jgi:hypothetical protein
LLLPSSNLAPSLNHQLVLGPVFLEISESKS